MNERFYVNAQLSPGPFRLTGEEAHHLAHVRRIRAGEVITLFNGDGLEYPALLISLSKNTVELSIQPGIAHSNELAQPLWLACPVPKGDRAHFLIEKLTELGVTCFIPLHTDRSIIQPRETKVEKWRRYIIEASKQCGRNVLMELQPLQSWIDFTLRMDLIPFTKTLLHPLGQPLSLSHFSRKPQLVAVGPEGGWTEHELQLASEHGWQIHQLGSRIMRMETAAIAMAAIAALS